MVKTKSTPTHAASFILRTNWMITRESYSLGFPGGSDSKEGACSAGGREFDPWVRKTPWRSEWQPTPVFLPGDFHGQRSLVGYSPWGHKESATTQQLAHTHTVKYAKNIVHSPEGLVLFVKISVKVCLPGF